MLSGRTERRTGPRLGLLLALLMLASLAAQADEPAALVRLARIAGTVEALHAEETGGAWLPAYPGDEFGPGWSLRTGAASKALLVFALDNTVVLKENSYVTINALDAGGGAQLETSAGGLLVNIKNHLQPGSTFQVDTGAAQAVVRGTKFGIVFRQGGQSTRPPGTRRRRLKRQVRFYGFEGTVTVRNGLGEQALDGGFDLDAREGQRLRRPLKGAQEAQDFLAYLERQAEFDQFDQQHQDLQQLREEREAKRKAAQEQARERRARERDKAPGRGQAGQEAGADGQAQPDHERDDQKHKDKTKDKTKRPAQPKQPKNPGGRAK
jgi:hypothetical protein